MVYSPELGYDPDEWEECPEPDHFLALPLYARVCLGVGTVLLSALFFWFLEANKRRGHLREVQEHLEEEKAVEKAIEKAEKNLKPNEAADEEEEELSAETRLERASQEAEQKANPERRRSSKRELSHEERMALLAWREEVHGLEQERLRASEEPAEQSAMEKEALQMTTEEIKKIDEQSQPQPQQQQQQHQEEPNREQKPTKPIWIFKKTTTTKSSRSGSQSEGEEVAGDVQVEDAGRSSNKQKLLEEERKEAEQKITGQIAPPASAETAADVPQEMLLFTGAGGEPISRAALVAKTEERLEKIAYDDDLLPADASATANQQLQQKLRRARELQPNPLHLEVPRPKELSRLHAEFGGGATPPSTPPDGVPLAEKLPELAAHYRHMADELTAKLLVELDDQQQIMDTSAGGAGPSDAEAAQAMAARHRDHIDGALAESGAPQEVRQQLARQLETHVANAVSQEMRRRSSSNILLQQQNEEQKIDKDKAKEEEKAEESAKPKPPEPREPQEVGGSSKKGSSSSEEGGFVKIRAPQPEDELVATSSGDLSPYALASPSSPPILLLEQPDPRLTPSPQLGTTTSEEEPEEGFGDGEGNVRVSVFSTTSGAEGDGDGMSTTADDIEFVPSARPSPLPPPPSATGPQQMQQQQTAVEQQTKSNEKMPGANNTGTLTSITTTTTATTVVERRQPGQLDADETEQMLALLQEYDNGNAVADEMADVEEERRRQFSSGATSSVGGGKHSSGGGDRGVISLPESAQRTPGSTSIPETPGSQGFDFIEFPQSPPPPVEGVVEDKEGELPITIEQIEPQQFVTKKTTIIRVEEKQDEKHKAVPLEEDHGQQQPEDTGAALLRRPEAVAEASTIVHQQQQPELSADSMKQQQPQERVEAQFKTTAATITTTSAASDHQKAEQFLQEALDYMAKEPQEKPAPGAERPKTVAGDGGQTSPQAALKRQSTFIVEEEMLESEEAAAPAAKAQKKPVAAEGGSTTAGGDGTSKQIRTNEVFDKPDAMLLFDDADDRDVTYAPEIQSMEVPPDQLSQADSLNLVDENFSEAGPPPAPKEEEAQQQGETAPRHSADHLRPDRPKIGQEAGEKEEEEKLVVVEEVKDVDLAVQRPWDSEGADVRPEREFGAPIQKERPASASSYDDPLDYGGEEEEVEEEAGDDEPLRRALTPREEAELHAEIDQIRRWSPATPRLADQMRRMQQSSAQAVAEKAEKEQQKSAKKSPQAPQFLRSYFGDESTSSLDSTVTSLRLRSMRQSSLLSAVGVSSTQEMLLKLTSLEALSEAMRKAGLESSNLIFGIDYTASNKYQGERSFGGRSLHSVTDRSVDENPYQQVIKIMGRTLAPFAGSQYGIPVFGFGDSTTGDWSVFPLNGTAEGECTDLDDVLRIYNRVTPGIDLSGPTNFAPLIYRAMEICHKRKDYHILVVIADGQVTNERATRKAIVSACQYPLSIIVVGVGDGPWDMMRVFDESLPKRPWDNFHFVEFHALVTEQREELTMHQPSELAFAVHSLLEIPDQYNTIRKLGMLLPTYYTRPQPHSPRSYSPKPQQTQQQQKK